MNSTTELVTRGSPTATVDTTLRPSAVPDHLKVYPHFREKQGLAMWRMTFSCLAEHDTRGSSCYFSTIVGHLTPTIQPSRSLIAMHFNRKNTQGLLTSKPSCRSVVPEGCRYVRGLGTCVHNSGRSCIRAIIVKRQCVKVGLLSSSLSEVNFILVASCGT